METDDEVFEVFKILARRKNRKGNLEFLVRWKSYGEDDDTWEPIENLQDCEDALEDFNNRLSKGQAIHFNQQPLKRKRVVDSPSRDSLASVTSSRGSTPPRTMPPRTTHVTMKQPTMNGPGRGVNGNRDTHQKKQKPQNSPPLRSKPQLMNVRQNSMPLKGRPQDSPPPKSRPQNSPPLNDRPKISPSLNNSPKNSPQLNSMPQLVIMRPGNPSDKGSLNIGPRVQKLTITKDPNLASNNTYNNTIRLRRKSLGSLKGTKRQKWEFLSISPKYPSLVNGLENEKPPLIDAYRVLTRKSPEQERSLDGGIFLSPRRERRQSLNNLSPRRSPQDSLGERFARPSPPESVGKPQDSLGDRFLKQSPESVSHRTPRKEQQEPVSGRFPRRERQASVSDCSLRQEQQGTVGDRSLRREPQESSGIDPQSKEPRISLGDCFPRREPQKFMSDHSPRGEPHESLVTGSKRRELRHKSVAKRSSRQERQESMAKRSPVQEQQESMGNLSLRQDLQESTADGNASHHPYMNGITVDHEKDIYTPAKRVRKSHSVVGAPLKTMEVSDGSVVIVTGRERLLSVSGIHSVTDSSGDASSSLIAKFSPVVKLKSLNQSKKVQQDSAAVPTQGGKGLDERRKASIVARRRLSQTESPPSAVQNKVAKEDRRSSVRQLESLCKYKEIVVKKCNGYTQIRLFTTTPERNALNTKALQELTAAFRNAKKDDSNLVFFSGSGSMFCSGLDLQCLRKHNLEERRKSAKHLAATLRTFISTIISFPKVIIVAVNGPAVGIGAAILPLCDIVYASDKAWFHFPYASLGQTPEGCSSYTIPEIIGMARASEMLYAGRKLTALEACSSGLVSHVFWPTSLMQEVIPRVQKMATTSLKALSMSKSLVRNQLTSRLESINEQECAALEKVWVSAEFYRQSKVFLEKGVADL